LEKHRLNGDNLIFHNFYPANSQEYLLWDSLTQKLFIYSTESNEIIKTLYEEGKHKDFYAPVFYAYNNELFFTRSMSNEVYKLNKNGTLDVSHRWDFGIKNIDLTKYNLPSDPSEKNRRINQMFEDSVIPYIVTNQFQNSIYHYAKIYFSWEESVNVFYSKKQGKQLVFNTFKEGLHFLPLYWTEDYVIGLGSANEKTAVNKSILNAENAKKFSSLNEESNPCLVKYYFRQNK
jgi:hypothetical protein